MKIQLRCINDLSLGGNKIDGLTEGFYYLGEASKNMQYVKIINDNKRVMLYPKDRFEIVQIDSDDSESYYLIYGKYETGRIFRPIKVTAAGFAKSRMEATHIADLKRARSYVDQLCRTLPQYSAQVRDKNGREILYSRRSDEFTAAKGQGVGSD